ncbi:MAG: cytochrome c oxidase subunit II [Rhodocyclales bacterium]|nr:cytochrome c oxidase subunit II [Rhodocyclales bacterium]MBH1974969.1 cytochrome c oxidase subunit II [Rhodocyclales bacterium]
MSGATQKLGVSRGVSHLVGGVALSLLASIANAAYQVNFQEPATKLAQTVSDLHMMMMYICGVIFVGVFGVMFYSIIKHRKAPGRVAATFHENTTVEILWTVIPTIILLVMVWPVTKALISMRDSTGADITIKATGYQWKWGYDYIKGEGEGIKFMSVLSTPRDQIEGKAPKGEHYLLEVDNHLVVPVGKKIRILTTAEDVIHAWYMPAFAVKQDAVPGFIRDTSFRAEREGTFRGQCAELCGKDHGFMPIVVDVVSEEKYATWVAEQKTKMAALAEDPSKVWTMAELMARGEAVYTQTCAACHQANGKGLPPAFPALDGSKVATGPKEGHLDMVLNGKPGSAMAAFGKQLSDSEIAAVVTYERNAWGNKVGDLVQPGEVKALRK